MIGEQVTQAGEVLRLRRGGGFFGFSPSLPKTLPLHSEIRCDETVLAHFASKGCLLCLFRSYRRSEDRRKEGFGDRI